MRAVIDASIIVRATIRPTGTVGPVLGRLRDEAYVLVYSDSLLDEVADVLQRPRIRDKYHLTNGQIQAILELLLLRGEAVMPRRQITVYRDPKDNKVLEAAIAGQADIIVTGDDDLLVLNPFEGVPIVGPATFLAMLAGTA